MAGLKIQCNNTTRELLEYRNLVESTGDSFWQIDLQRRQLTYISSTVEQLLGYTAEEVLSLPLETVFPIDLIEKAQKNQSPIYKDTYQNLNKIGQLTRLRLCACLLQEAARPPKLIGIIRRQTSPQYAEKPINTASPWVPSKAIPATLSQPPSIENPNNPLIGTCQWNLKSHVFSCSPEFCRLFDKEYDWTPSTDYHYFWHKIYPNDRKKIKQAIHDLLATGSPVYWDFRLQISKKSMSYLRGIALLWHDKSHVREKIISIIFDVTGEQTRNALCLQKISVLKNFAQTIPGNNFILDEDGRVVAEFGSHSLLLNSDATAGKKLGDLVPAQTARQLLKLIHDSMQQSLLQFGEYTLETFSGERVFRLRIAPMQCRINGRLAAACQVVDITEQKQIEKQLTTATKKSLKKNLLNNLIERKTTASLSLLDQAWLLNLNLSRPSSCLVIVLEGWQGKSRLTWQKDRQKFSATIDNLLYSLESKTQAIVWESKDGICILYPAVDKEEPSKAQEEVLAEQLAAMIQEYFADLIFSVGIAEFHMDTFYNLPTIYTQACCAAYFGKLIHPNRNVHHYLDLGIFQILPCVSNHEELQAYVTRTLGKLLEYDHKKDRDLTNTLAALLKCENIKTVAASLFVHPKTIEFRKKRIEKILGSSIDTPEMKLTLSTALKCRQILQRLSPM